MAQLQNLSWLPVIIAAVAAWMFGAVYYSVLGKAWLAAQGTTMEQMKAANAGKSGAAKAAPFVLSFIAEIVMGMAMSGILFHIGIYGVGAGLFSGAMIWIGVLLIIGGILGWMGR
jgi:Protein of unknown function (DUF1761)